MTQEPGYTCPRCHVPLDWPESETAGYVVGELPRDWVEWAAVIMWILVLGLVAVATVLVILYVTEALL